MAIREINGAPLFFEHTGEGTSVLLIHGNGGISDLYAPVIERLAPSYRTIAYDRRSFGRSKAEPPPSVATHVSDAAALLRTLDAGPAIVVGWSVGGVVALHLATEHPDLVAGLVLAEAAVLRQAMSVAIVRALVGWEFTRLVFGDRRGALNFFHWASGSRRGGNHFDAYPDEWREPMLAHAKSIWAEGGWNRGAGGEHLDVAAVAKLEIPVAVLQAELSDRSFAPCTRWLMTNIPTARLVEVAGATHMIPTDAPQVVARVVREVDATIARDRARAG